MTDLAGDRVDAPLVVDHHPIRLVVNDDLHRNRLTVFVRLILAIPHVIWLVLWGIVAWLAWIVNWFATLFAGRSPDGLHNFLATYLRYQTHVYSYVLLIADPFPAFIISGIMGYLNRALAFFAWFIALVMGRVPEGLRNFAAFALRYEQQTAAYAMLLTQRYPSFNVSVTE